MSSGRLWTCCKCGKVDVWGRGWSWWGSLKEREDGNIGSEGCPIVCSTACRAKVTDADRRKPKKGELHARAVAERKRARLVKRGQGVACDPAPSVPRLGWLGTR